MLSNHELVFCAYTGAWLNASLSFGRSHSGLLTVFRTCNDCRGGSKGCAQPPKQSKVAMISHVRKGDPSAMQEAAEVQKVRLHA
jgi:hypothetical protein